MKKNKIIFFLKNFKKKEHMMDFLNGKLYLNTVSYFRNLEEKSKNSRADEKEGLSLICQADDVKLELNGYQFQDLVGQIEMRKLLTDDKYVLCVFAGTTNESNIIEDNIFKKNKLNQIKEDLSISDEFKNLGEYSVLIQNTTKFINRIVKNIEKLNYDGHAGLVKYYDRKKVNSSFSNVDAVFNKSDEYKYQKEYRFVIDTKNNINEALIFDIGSIEDIATQIDLSNLKWKNHNISKDT